MCACVCLYVFLCVVGRRVCMRVCVHQTLKMPTSCWLSLRGADTLTHNASQTSRSQTAAAAWTWTRLGTSANVRSPCVRVCMFVVVYVCRNVCTYVCMSVCVRMRVCIVVPIKDLVETVAEVMGCTVRLVLSKEVVEASGRLQFARRVTPSVFLSACPSL